jgi:carboxymethylenebutenolidase
MIRLLVGLCVTALMASPTFAQDWAKARLEKSPRHGEWAKVKHGEREVQAFVVYPEVKEKAPAVVVIHEIFGLTDWVRGVADQLAEAGYIAITPDLLSGAGPKGGGSDSFKGEEVRKAIMSLPPDQVTADLNAATDYVAKLPACNGKVAVAGFCWGGGQAFRLATNNKAIKAAFVYYGTGPDKAEDVGRIAAPVYGFYGGNDARVNATIAASTELMKKAAKTYEPVTYEGAGHGFMRAGEAPDASPANKKARDEAWTRWKELLKKL